MLTAIAEARSDATSLLLGFAPTPAAHSVPPPVTTATPNISLQALLDEYVSVKKSRLKPDTVRRYRDCLDRYWADHLSQPAENLTPDVFRAHFITLPSPAQANHSLRIIRALFNFYNAAHDKNLLNPVQKVLKLEGAFIVRPRDRLIADEDQARWHASIQQGSRTSAELFTTLALTGLRLGEGLRLSWECVDFEKSSLTIPETKNGKPLLIPMGSRLKALLSKRKTDLRRESGRVFGLNPRNERLEVAASRKRSGVDWSAHDLRRTFVTLATRLEVPDRMVKRLVNHTERDVTGMHYIRLSVDTLRPYTQRIEDELFRLWRGDNEQPN
ncbi:tyrosine-type recombinase/integrase [Uliginosibacterium paludis]|uniref:Tyrosine-type recombinase/integrase n=1 Tax=Uliginosibacterium paludis TaxID=1615952 RepID=A0ABV2CKX3_9RHOO